MINIRKKFHVIFLLMMILFFTGLLSSCGETEEVEELRISSDCVGMVCSVGVANASLVRTTDVIGRVREKVYKLNSLDLTKQCTVSWQVDHDKLVLADKKTLSKLNLDICGSADGEADCSLSDIILQRLFLKNQGNTMFMQRVL